MLVPLCEVLSQIPTCTGHWMGVTALFPDPTCSSCQAWSGFSWSILQPSVEESASVGAEGLLPSGDEFSPSFLKKICIYLFWLCWVFIAAWAFLQLWQVGATLQLQCVGFSLWWLLLLWSTGFRVCEPQHSVVAVPRLQGLGSVVVVHGLSCCPACGIFPDQGLNHVPCIGRKILHPEPLGKLHPFLSLHLPALVFHFARNNN